jgi:hypothetical protein
VEKFIGGVVDTGKQFIAGVVDTRVQFIAGVDDTGDKFSLVSLIPVRNNQKPKIYRWCQRHR